MGKVFSLTFSLIQLIALVLFIIISYELVRWAVVSFFKRRFMRSVTAFLRKHQVRFDQYKLTNKLIIKDQLLHNREVNQQILEKAQKEDIPFEEAREQAEEYIDEIVPTFNLLSYYKFGYTIANLLLKFLYEVVIDEQGKKQVKDIPEDALVVYVMNHRSNIDYLLVAYMLMENISVSYAVGEWARVFPLDIIFKSFGAYFIRRNYRDPLYHAVLKNYIQLISENKVTQGIFLEGALSRNGQFRAPKTGLLDYILTTSQGDGSAGSPTKIVFVPVGINYDWILEDQTLIREWKEGKHSMTMRDHLFSFFTILVKSPYLLLVNALRLLTGRMKEHGYVSVKFGRPVPLEHIADRGEFEDAKSYQERRAELKKVGSKLLRRISDVVPITPVSLLSLTLIEHGNGSLSKEACLAHMRSLLQQLEARDADLMMGKEYAALLKLRDRLESERWFRKKELLEFEEDLLKEDEIEKTLQLAVELLVRRKIIRVSRDEIHLISDKRDYLEYYANTIRHFLSREVATPVP